MEEERQAHPGSFRHSRHLGASTETGTPHLLQNETDKHVLLLRTKNLTVGQKTGTTANTDQYHDLIPWHTDNDGKLASFYQNVCLISQSSVSI